MCTISKDTFTGAEIISVLGGTLTAVGNFNAAAIDSDIETNGDFSQVGICATIINQWAVSCGVNISLFAPNVCGVLGMGFKWFCLYSYYDLYLNTQVACGCECSDNEKKALDLYAQNACKYLSQIAPCMATKFKTYISNECKPITKIGFKTQNTTVVNGCVLDDVDLGGRYCGC